MKKIIFFSFLSIISLIISCNQYAMEQVLQEKEESNLKEKCAAMKQDEKKITLFSLINKKHFLVQRSVWEKASFIREMLESKRKKDYPIQLFWKTSEVEQMNSYLQRRDSAIKDLSILEHTQLINNLSGLALTEQNDCDDYDSVVQRFIARPNNNRDQENIECLLKEVDSLQDDISPLMKKELLQLSEFYRFISCQSDEIIEEEQLSETVVIKRYWGNTIHLCDREKNITKQYQNVSNILKIDNVVIISILSRGIVKIIDLNDDLREKKEISILASNLIRINNHKIAIVQMAMMENNGHLIVYDIKSNEIGEIKGISNAFYINDYLIGIKHGSGYPNMDAFYHPVYEKHTLYFFNVETAKYQEIYFRDLFDSLRINDHTIAMRLADEVKLYNIQTKEERTIKFQGLTELLQVNDHTIVLSGTQNEKNLIKIINIEENRGTQLEHLGKIYLVNKHTIAIYCNDCMQLYDIESGSIKSILVESKDILFIESISLIKDLAIIGYKTISYNYSIKVFNVKNSKLINQIKTNEKFEVRGDTIWLMYDNVLQRLGPSIHLKKLNIEQLLLCLSAIRSGKKLREVNSTIWKSIPSDIQQNLLKDENFYKEVS
ncbi:MAG: hypothetical protein WCD44_00300 [Candidatus Babeliales bacterium]